MIILGLDEAGRGPVLGPMVIGAVLLETGQTKALQRLAVRDSKALTRKRREALFVDIQASLLTDTLVLEPHQLESNLTQVALEGLAYLINKHAPTHVYLDAPVPPSAIPSFVSRLRERLDDAPKITAENKAEDKYPVVAAASIVAKVTRDRAMQALHERHGDVGWGYPGEPKTQAFLQRCVNEGAFPPCVRTRWATVQRLKQQALFERH